MNILMMSLMYPDDEIDEVSRRSLDGLQNQINNYQHAVIEGLRTNLREGERVDVLNSLPVGTYPRHYKQLLLKDARHEGGIMELGGINLPWLKQRARERKAEQYIRSWVNQDKHNRVVLLYTLYLPYMRAIVQAKKHHPELRAAVIVTDLPNELGISSGRRGLLKRMEYARGDESLRLCKDFDGFVLLTEHMKEALPVTGKDSVIVEGLIADKETHEPIASSIASSKPIVLYTGTINRELGIPELIEAFRQMPECELWLCGKGDAQKEVEDAARTHKNIRYYGFVAQKEALRLQAQAKLLINPRSPEGLYTRYSFPSKTLEYMRSGKPVLCYRLAGIPESYDTYLYYINGDGSQGICDSIRSLLKQPDEALQMRGLAGRKYALAYKNPSAQCKRVMDMLRKLDKSQGSF